MKWSLTKTKKKIKIKNISPPTNSLEHKINKQLIIISNGELIDKLLLKNLEPELNNLIKRILEYLTEEEDDADEAILLFDELARLRSIFNEQEEKLSKSVVTNYMKKIRFVAFELKKRLIRYKLERTTTKEKAR